MSTGATLVTGDPAFIDASQALRYRVFYEEMSAKPTPAMARDRRDFDDFDACTALIPDFRTRLRKLKALREKMDLAIGE
ncbi:MAG: GNAT family N-acyltransferase [Alphaproteobacteria bacterium]